MGLHVVRAAVLGRPVERSLSPVLHRAAYRALDLDWTYDAIDCGADELAGLLTEAGEDVAGFSCTMPLKRVALELAASVGTRAQAAGSANTLLPGADGGWVAENTDVGGILAALAEHQVVPREVVVLGAGGTAQAMLVALGELGVGRCTALVRAPGHSAGLLATAARVGLSASIRSLDDRAPLAAADLIVSTLPPGAADRLATTPWHPGQVVLDVVYDPWPTPLAAAVATARGRVVSGTLMLLHQAAEQVELMTGRLAPLDAMHEALCRETGHSARPQ